MAPHCSRPHGGSIAVALWPSLFHFEVECGIRNSALAEKRVLPGVREST
jgi:hypothetical protein